MGKMIILDLRGDRHGMGLRKMMDDGAFPDSLKDALQDVMPDVFPFEDTENTRDICPGLGFPVQDPIHAIINHLYATAQRPMMQAEDLDKVRAEATNVMDADGDFDEDMKKTVLQGSKKVYNRTLANGTEIKVEVTTPMEKEAAADPLRALQRFRKKKTASALGKKTAGLKFDIDKFLNKVANLRAGSPQLKDAMQKVSDNVRKTGLVVLNVEDCKSNHELNECISKVAKLTGKKPGEVIEEGVADDESGNKTMFHGELIDTRKLTKKPFDSYANAKKAVGKQVAELVCSKATGNVDLTKLKDLEDFAESDSLMSKLADRIVNVLRWKE